MFAGIVQGMATVSRLVGGRAEAGNARLEVEFGPLLGEPPLGASIAINGCCLTLAARRGTSGAFDVVPETLRRTNLGELKAGDPVNIEHSLRVGDRIDGHFVQGHIDGVGVVESNEAAAGEWRIAVRPPEELLPYLVPKGSVAIDGTSLTIAAVPGGLFEVALIPTTLAQTVLGRRKRGDRVNLETDIVARTVVAQLRAMFGPQAAGQAQGVTMDRLRAAGFIA